MLASKGKIFIYLKNTNHIYPVDNNSNNIKIRHFTNHIYQLDSS